MRMFRVTFSLAHLKCKPVTSRRPNHREVARRVIFNRELYTKFLLANCETFIQEKSLRHWRRNRAVHRNAKLSNTCCVQDVHLKRKLDGVTLRDRCRLSGHADEIDGSIIRASRTRMEDF